MARSTRLRWVAGIAAGVAAVAVPAIATTASASASASTSPGSSLVTLQQGIDPTAIAGTTVFGDTPADTPETVSFILKANNLGVLEAKVSGGAYNSGNFLSVRQFASAYGQAKVASELSAYLAKYGITTSAYKDALDVVATGTAGEFDSALSVSQKQYRVPAVQGKRGGTSIPAQTIHAPSTAPRLPAYIGDSVLAVLGLSSYSDEFTHNLVHTATSGAKISGAKAPNTSASGTDCVALTGLAGACNTPTDFAKEYGLTPVAKKATGAGQTVGIVTLAGLDVGGPEYYWKNVAGINRTGTVTVKNIDGGPGAPNENAGTGETDLDVEQAGGVAPGANVIVYQAPNTDPGFTDAFFAAASDNVADSVSASWGESETYVQAAVAAGTETSAYQATFDEAFLEYAAQGQSSFTSSGDEGAYTASNPGDLGTTNLSVDVPGSSPYITSAGGTTNPWSATLSSADGSVSADINVAAQRAWAWDYLWQPFATVDGVSKADIAVEAVSGGGGGYSVDEPRPSYQKNFPGISDFKAVGELIPSDYQTVTGGLVEPTAFTVPDDPAVISGHQASGRVQPDISADADPYSGYLLYDPSAAQVGNPVLQGGWGGTSYVAPQLNGAAAVINSYLGHRAGFWNPAAYSLAAGGHSPFSPLNTTGTSNDNLYYTGGGAGSRYNPATGLGVPNLSSLAAGFKAGA